MHLKIIYIYIYTHTFEMWFCLILMEWPLNTHFEVIHCCCVSLHIILPGRVIHDLLIKELWCFILLAAVNWQNRCLSQLVLSLLAWLISNCLAKNTFFASELCQAKRIWRWELVREFSQPHILFWLHYLGHLYTVIISLIGLSMRGK